MTESKQPTKAEAMEALNNVFALYVRDKRLAYGQLEVVRRYIEQAGTEWQPIETAPKDGTQVLLFGRSGMLSTQHTYISGRYVKYKSAWCDDQNDRLCNSGFEPTLWKPLGPPPETTDD